MNRLLLLAILSLVSFYSFCQVQRNQINGKVVGSNNEHLSFVTVMVYAKTDSSRLTGTTSLEDGTFSLETNNQEVYLEVSFMGYKTKQVSEVTFVNNQATLGLIRLSENDQSIGGVTVRAEKSSVEFKLDKRVFNVGKDLSSTGASALEVLNNVPSVNVNIEGEISLRGSSGVQVLINGKPSVIASEQGNAMGTITADMIEKIEVITNPSAKYDAENINQDLKNNTTVNSEGIEYRNEFFYNIVLGTDYYINKYNVITLSGNFAYEIEDQPSETNFEKLDENGLLLSNWNRTEVTSALNPKWQYELNYKKDFKDKKDHNLLFTSIGRFFGKDQSSEFANEEVFNFDGVSNQRTTTNFNEANYSFNLDYTNPISDKVTLEVGSQYVATDVGNDFSVSNLLNNEWVQNDGLTNVFDFDQNVLGLYSPFIQVKRHHSVATFIARLLLKK